MFMYLQLFVFELQQNNKIVAWEIKWIFNLVKIWSSNAHKNFDLLVDIFFFDQGRQN